MVRTIEVPYTPALRSKQCHESFDEILDLTDLCYEAGIR